MRNFSVTFKNSDHCRVLELNGELDAHTAPDLEAAIQKCVDEGNIRIIINGSNLQYISSAGLGVFMAFIDEIREQSGDIKIVALQPKVYNVFDLLGFPELFDILDSEEAAMQRFGDGRTLTN